MRCGDVRLLRTLGGVDVMGQERAALNKLTMPPPMGRDRVLVWSPNKLIVVLNLGRALLPSGPSRWSRQVDHLMGQVRRVVAANQATSSLLATPPVHDCVHVQVVWTGSPLIVEVHIVAVWRRIRLLKLQSRG